MAIALCISQPPFPLSPFLPFYPFFRFVPARASPLENVTAAILVCFIALGHRETAENLCRYSWPFNRVCPQSKVSEK